MDGGPQGEVRDLLRFTERERVALMGSVERLRRGLFWLGVVVAVLGLALVGVVITGGY